jgi:hypothetical protein
VIWAEEIEDDEGGPSREQLEDQVEALAELLRVAHVALEDAETPEVDLLAAIEDLFRDLELEL